MSRVLTLTLIALCGSKSFAADLLPSNFSPKAALEAGSFGITYDYEKRSTIHLDPYGLDDHTVTAERSALSTGIGLPYGFQLGLGISGISSHSKTLGNEKRFAGAMASLEKVTKVAPAVAFGLGIFGEGPSSGAISPSAQDFPSAAAQEQNADPEEEARTDYKTSDAVIGRSGSAKGGAFGRILFGKDVLRGSLLGGVRYRKPEAYYWYRLRHETFFQSQLEIWPVSFMGAFFQYNQRNLQIADTRREEISYRTRELVELRGGAMVKVDMVEVAVFGGAADYNNNNDHGFGNGRKIIGASLSLILNEGEKAADSEKKAAKKKAKPVTTYVNHEGAREINRGDEIILDANSLAKKPKKDIGTVMDDFELVDQRMKKSGIKKNLKSEDELADEEIQRLKETEVKQERLKMERQQQDDLIVEERLNDRRDLNEDLKEEADLSRQVQDELKALPAVENGDMRWNGLD